MIYMVDFKKPMCRGDKSINKISSIHSILKKAMLLRLGLCYENIPYVIPLNFVFDETAKPNGVIYLHSALDGLKIDILHENNEVCFEVEQNLQLVTADRPCNWGMKYKSVIGHGKAYFEDNEWKQRVLDLFMDKYSDEKLTYQYSDAALAAVCIIKIEITSINGKRSGYS